MLKNNKSICMKQGAIFDISEEIDMGYKFSDLVDITKLRFLMEAFYDVTGIASTVIEADGNIVIAVGWRDICQKFHRIHPITKQQCQKSDNYIYKHLGRRNSYICYECANGLIDAAAPIVIDGKHVATVFHGQFFFEEPEIKRFTAQAHRYGFDVKEYLAALSMVPIISQDRLDSIMKYFLQLAEMLAELGLAQLRQLEQEEKRSHASDLQVFRIFNSTPNIAIQGHDLCGRLTFWNSAAEELYGFTCEEVMGRRIDETIMNTETAANFLRIIREIDETDHLYGPVEWTVRDKQGQEKIVYSTVFPVRLQRGKEFICMDVDITDQKLLEREIARLDRLNLVGEMAASIGHEVRNPMTTVRGYLQILADKQCFGHYADRFTVMIEELDRMDQIISEFLSLAKNKHIDKQQKNLNQIIEVMTPLIYADAVKNNIFLDIILDKIPDLHLDEKEMRQLLLNLVRNALEATPSGGRIKINTFCKQNEVVLVVQDSGGGIPKEVRDKIGTPFFTTKPEGTGLGLAICFSIATRHNAKILIESDSFGTAFSIRFMVPDTATIEKAHLKM